MSDNNEPIRPKHLAFSIEIDDKSGKTYGLLIAADVRSKLRSADVDKALSEAGILNWAIDNSVISTLVNNFGQKVLCRLAIAERRDATFKVVLSPDDMAAYIDVVPAQGGIGLTVATLSDGLISNLVAAERINLASLNEVIAAPKAQRFTVAIGKHAIPGVDSEFKSLVAEQSSPAADKVEDKHGNIDYLAGKPYIIIEAQTAIMERVAPQPGKDGYNIFGQPLAFKPGTITPWAKKMPGTFIDKKNQDILISKVSGHPVLFQNGGRIDDSLVFDKIDLTTGHITFDGSVLIKGDVHADMKVEASGDIFIKGVVERAQIKAGNNLTVAGGILGDPNIEVPEEGLPVYDCILEAGGSIEAKYINLACLIAGKNITVREYVFNSNLKAGNKVTVGRKGGKGKLVGGETHAVVSVIANTLGSQAYSMTKITLGSSEATIDLLQKLDFIRDQRIGQKNKLRELLPTLKPAGSDTIERSEDELHKIQKIEATLLVIEDALHEINRRRKNAIRGEETYPKPFICAKSASYPNCHLDINGISIRTKTEQKAITYEKRNGKIVRKK
jgi:uncharacterized protein (DUF342 family)